MWRNHIVLLLLLAIFVEAKPYRGGELRTIDTYRYGRFEVRVRSAPGSGVVSSLFTYHELGASGIEEWNEIDIEWLGRYNDEVQYNTITDWQVGHEHRQPLAFDPAADFHVHGFEWTPDYVAWFVDRVEVYRQEGLHVGDLDHYQKMMMNIWQPSYADWAGNFDANILPVYAIYDWARYYVYVPGTGNTGTDNAFILFWQDDFDYWNIDRWQKASHTWDGNNAQFTPANVAFQDGYMILCLTTPDELGYNGPSLGTESGQQLRPMEFRMLPAYPNPFNGSTRIELVTARESVPVIRVFNMRGGLVEEMVLNGSGAGSQTVIWDGTNHAGEPQPSGNFLVQLSQGSRAETQQILLLK